MYTKYSLKELQYEVRVDDLSERWNEFIGLIQDTTWQPVVAQGYPDVVRCLKHIKIIGHTLLMFVRQIRATGLPSTQSNVTYEICGIPHSRLVRREPQPSQHGSGRRRLLEFIAERVALSFDSKHIRQTWRASECIGWTIYSCDKPLSSSTRASCFCWLLVAVAGTCHSRSHKRRHQPETTKILASTNPMKAMIRTIKGLLDTSAYIYRMTLVMPLPTVQARPNAQPRVIFQSLFPPMNGGIFGV